MILESNQLELLNNLTKTEKDIVKKILNELQDKGESSLYNDILYADYKEIPVDIETFITNDNYLGKAWKDAEQKIKLYPFWLNVLKEIFPNNLDTNYDTLLESGARGIGKSEIACGCVCAYLMYRVMCLKNPLDFYHLKPTEKICFAFMNIKLDLAEEIALSKFQKTIQLSPWFMSRGSTTTYKNSPYWVPPEPISLIIGSQSDDIIGKPIFFCFFDEISFIRNQDIEVQKKKALNMINTAYGGAMTRFIYKGKNPTMIVIASSKRSEQSFMEFYIRKMSETDKRNVYIVDKAVWDVKPKGTYSDETFCIALGNKFLTSVVIPREDEDKIRMYEDRGYRIIRAPIDFRERALEDLDTMLCDFAGISSANSNKYMSPDRVLDVIDESIFNPLPDIIEVGNGKDDTAQYSDFFNFDVVPRDLLSKPLFIHLDMSLSGDFTGIAGVWIVGKKVTKDDNPSKDLSYRLAFSTAIKAPKGRQISFEKNRNFIRWLKEKGFFIKEITSDTYQSYDLQQQLKSEGFNCSILSVDRVDDHICRPYQYLRSTIYEKRFLMYKSNRLYDEFVQIERNNNTGKVDHPPGGHKDILDSVCGATYTASKYAEEFAFNYGESLDVMLEVNHDKQNVNQLIVNFEDELKKIHDPFGKIDSSKKENSQQSRTTNNKSEEEKERLEQAMYAQNGLLYW